MEQSRQKLSDLLHGSALPQPPRKRALLFATIAAILGALACGLAAHTHQLRVGYLTLGIGVLVGMAVIRARGYGKPLMISAGVLTVLAIASAYILTFWLVTLSWANEKARGDMTHEAAAWQALENPTDEQVIEFARKWEFDYATREAFERYPGKMLTWYADNKPTQEEWRAWEIADSSFQEFLAVRAGAVDIVFHLLAVLLAAGLIYLRTSKLEHAARQRAIAQRQE